MTEYEDYQPTRGDALRYYAAYARYYIQYAYYYLSVGVARMGWSVRRFHYEYHFRKAAYLVEFYWWPIVWRVSLGLLYSAALIYIVGLWSFPPHQFTDAWAAPYLTRLMTYGTTLRTETYLRLSGMTAFIVYLSLAARFRNLKLRDPLSRVVWAFVFRLSRINRHIVMPIITGAMLGAVLVIAATIAWPTLFGFPLHRVMIAGNDLSPWYMHIAVFFGALLNLLRHGGRMIDKAILTAAEAAERTKKLAHGMMFMAVTGPVAVCFLWLSWMFNQWAHGDNIVELVMFLVLAGLAVTFLILFMRGLHEAWFAIRPSVHRIDEEEKVEGDARRATQLEALVALHGKTYGSAEEQRAAI